MTTQARNKGSWSERLASMKQLGQYLQEKRLVTQPQIEEALTLSREQNKRIGVVLQELGYITELDVVNVFGEQIGIEVIPNLSYKVLQQRGFDSAFFGKFPYEMLERFGIIPFKLDDAPGESSTFVKKWRFHVVMSNPWQYEKVVKIAEDYKKRVLSEKLMASLKSSGSSDIVMPYGGDIQIAIEVYFSTSQSIQNTIGELSRYIANSIDIVEDNTEQSAMRQVREILTQAVQMDATDVHISPLNASGGLWVRFRIDGPLVDIMRNGRVSENEYNMLLNRVMNMANMDISRKREPQDGSMKFRSEGNEHDMRIAVIPTTMMTQSLDGCKIQVRILKKASDFSIGELGFFKSDLEIIKRLYTQPSGVFLVAGPTSAGKTTTIYSCLRTMDLSSQCCYTVEDPVEYGLEGAYQIQVSEREGRGFATILKSLMRLDPDIVFMGEMRDQESALMSMQIANTGHTVFSTIHTNSAYHAPLRLVSMGIPAYLLVGNLNGIVSQRLVRRSCDACLEPYAPSRKVLTGLGLAGNEAEFRRSTGKVNGAPCPKCRGKGYLGRMGIFEILPLALYDGWENLINKPGELRRFFAEKKCKSLADDALAKMKQGYISPDNLFEVFARAELIDEESTKKENGDVSA